MAHIEDMDCKPAVTLRKSGATVNLFACGIDISSDSDYTLVVVKQGKEDDRNEPGTVFKASIGRPHPTYKKSRLDPDLTPFVFSLPGTAPGDKVIIRKGGNDFSPAAWVVDSNLSMNEWLLKYSPPSIRRQNVWVADAIEPVTFDVGPMSPRPRGLAIHVTANEGNAKANVKYWNGKKVAAAHFIIERDGTLVQCVALTRMAQAQGDRSVPGNANFHWFSVEFVCAMNNAGTDGFLTGMQIITGNRLFGGLCGDFRLPHQLAAPFLGDAGPYGTMAKALASAAGVTGAKTREEAGQSGGLSCHRWLGGGHACPGLIGLRIMPDLINITRVQSGGIDLEM